MLRITVEIVPHGDESKKTVFAVAEIALEAVSDDKQIGKYSVKTSHTGKWFKAGKWWKKGILTAFHRLRRSPWELITCALATTWLKEEPEQTEEEA